MDDEGRPTSVEFVDLPDCCTGDLLYTRRVLLFAASDEFRIRHLMRPQPGEPVDPPPWQDGGRRRDVAFLVQESFACALPPETSAELGIESEASGD
jgi:hypothetical protein